jgi:hypothetical protein
MTYHLPYRPPASGGKYKASQKKGQNSPPQQRNQKPFRVAVPQNKTRQGSASGATTYVKGPCYNCGQNGHFAKYCPHPKKQQATYPARVHHTTIEDIPEGEPVTAGMFSINQHPRVVLFDSGSSHSFMSQAFARKYNQEIKELGYGYRISSAGADVLTNQMVRGVTLDMGDRRFQVNLIVMPGLVLDVILGMNW